MNTVFLYLQITGPKGAANISYDRISRRWVLNDVHIATDSSLVAAERIVEALGITQQAAVAITGAVMTLVSTEFAGQPNNTWAVVNPALRAFGGLSCPQPFQLPDPVAVNQMSPPTTPPPEITRVILNGKRFQGVTLVWNEGSIKASTDKVSSQWTPATDDILAIQLYTFLNGPGVAIPSFADRETLKNAIKTARGH